MKWQAEHEGILRWKASLDPETPEGHDDTMSDDGDDEMSTETPEEKPKYPWQVDPSGTRWQSVLQSPRIEEPYWEDGIFLLVAFESRMAKIVRYSEGSYFSSQVGIHENDVKWGPGALDELVSLARAKLDPAAVGLRRKLQPGDNGYDQWSAMYDAVVVWAAAGFPAWRGRFTKGVFSHFDEHKTRYAHVVAREARAAVVIQAAYRAWKWRLETLYNPNTDVGARRIHAEFRRMTTTT